MPSNLPYAEPPFVWPDPRQLAGFADPDVAADAALWSAARIAQVVTTDLDDEGVDRLERLLGENPELNIRAVVVVYPTCRTREEHLFRLVGFQEAGNGRFEAHLLMKEWNDHPASNIMLLYCEGGSDPLLRFGPTPNLECARPLGPWHANLVFHPDPRLTDSMRRWFDYAWLCGAPLSEETAHIPHLLRPQGSQQAAALWEQYRAAIEGDSLFAVELPQVLVNPETGEVTATDAATGASIAAPSAALHLPKADPIAQAAMALLSRGTLVAVDKSTRAKPLDVPISPRLFGLTPQQQHGRVTVERSFRVSVLNEADLKELEKYRRRISLLVDKFTASLGDGLHWMPVAARPQFEQMVEEQNEAGMARFAAILGGDPAEFVDGQRERLREDAKNAFRAVTGTSQELSDGQFEAVLDSLKERLQSVLSAGRLLPQVTYPRIVLDLNGADENDPLWGQVLLLLTDLAVKQREAVASPFFWREFAPKPQTEYLAAMDALGDFIRGAAGTIAVAQRELDLLRELRDATDAPPRERCIAVWDMVLGSSGLAEDLVVKRVHPKI